MAKSKAGHYPGARVGALKLLYVSKEVKTAGGRRTNRTWYCQCSCGRFVEKSTQQLIRMNYPSCGCIIDVPSKGFMKQRMKPKLVATSAPPVIEKNHWLWRTEEKFRLCSSGMVFQKP